MGLLESLIILRLFTSVQGFAIDIRKRLGSMISIQHSTGNAPSDEELTEDNEQGSQEKKKFCETNDRRCKLESLKLIEDSLMLLLGDNAAPGVLDLQENVARNSGVINAHMMSTVLSIMDIPRRWVEHAISKIEEEKARQTTGAADSSRSGIANKIGVYKGVGGIDVLAYMIALFTMPEEELLCLLTREQMENLILEFPDGFF